jgi:drug/metabolite transporter (DMT)-like permease
VTSSAPLSHDETQARLRRARLKVLAAVLCATVFVIPFKLAARDGRGAGAALGLLGFVVVFFWPRAVLRYVRLNSEKRTRSLALAWKLAIVAALGNVAQGYAFEELHAGVAASVIQLNVVFVGVIGAVWLKEALNGARLVGIVFVLGGLFFVQGSGLAEQFEWNTGILWGVGGALCFSLMDLLARRRSSEVDAAFTNLVRAFLAALLLALVPGAVSQLLAMGGSELLACGVAAILGPGLARELLLSAAREVPAVESALLQQLRPLLALPLSSVVFSFWPTAEQWAGCLLIFAGVCVSLLFSRRPAT